MTASTLPSPGSTDRRWRPARQQAELLCVAAVTPMKGHDVLVAALATLLLPWRCTCAGPVSPDPDFVERVTEQASPGRHRPPHPPCRPARPHHLGPDVCRCDVLVHPSRVETYGMVVTEALAHGLPSSARRWAASRRPRHGGARDARADGRPGLLVPADDAAALAAALRTWLTDAALRERLRQRARERRLHLHPWSRTAEQVSAVLATLAGTDERF